MYIVLLWYMYNTILYFNMVLYRTHLLNTVKSNELPTSMNNNNLFQIADNPNYDLRSNGNDFLLQKPRTNYMKKSITYNGVIAWNKLPNNVKAANMSTIANSRLFSTANIYIKV